MAVNVDGRMLLTADSGDRLYCDWEVVNQNYYQKTSTLELTILAWSHNDYDCTFKNLSLEINNEVVYEWNGEYTLAPGETLDKVRITVTHPNRTRDYDIEMFYQGWILEDNYWNGLNDTDNFTLPSCNSFPSLELSGSPTTETEISVTCGGFANGWDTLDVTVYKNGVQVDNYYARNGSSDDVNISFTNLEDNTSYQVVAEVTEDSYTSTEEIYITTYNYPYCTSTPNFVIGNSLLLKFFNPLGRTMTIKVLGNDGSTCYTYTSTSTSISGWNNANKYYQSIPNSKTGTYSVQVTTSVSDITVVGGTYSTVENDCIPAISSISYLDNNNSTVAITGDNQKIIQSYGTVRFTFSNCSSKKYATISRIDAIINGVSHYVSGSGTSGTFYLNYGTINSSSNITATIVITDSRGYTKSYSKQITMLEYSTPYISATANRTQNFYSETTLRGSASISSLNGGNSVTLKYAYKKLTDANYGAETVMQQYTDYILDLDNTYEWNIKITATDVLGSSQLVLKVNKGIPIVFFDRLLNATGFNCFPELQGGLYSEGYQLDNQIYVGSQLLYAEEFTQQNSNSSDIMSAFCTELINALFTGITIPDNYEKAFKLTALAKTDDVYCRAWLSIGDVATKYIERWFSGSMKIPYWEVISSNIFKATELSLENNTMSVNFRKGNTTERYNVESDDLLKIQSHSYFEGDTFTFKNITIHAYLVKKNSTTPSNIVLNQDKVFLRQFGLDVVETIYPNKRYEINTDTDVFIIYVYNGSTLEHTIRYSTVDNLFYEEV